MAALIPASSGSLRPRSRMAGRQRDFFAGANLARPQNAMPASARPLRYRPRGCGIWSSSLPGWPGGPGWTPTLTARPRFTAARLGGGPGVSRSCPGSGGRSWPRRGTAGRPGRACRFRTGIDAHPIASQTGGDLVGGERDGSEQPEADGAQASTDGEPDRAADQAARPDRESADGSLAEASPAGQDIAASHDQDQTAASAAPSCWRAAGTCAVYRTAWTRPMSRRPGPPGGQGRRRREEGPGRPAGRAAREGPGPPAPPPG